LFLTYTFKLCCLLPLSKERGAILPHIFAIKCAALAIYPTYAEYVNYCYGFMTADLPWFNSFLGDKFGNKNDFTPKPFSMYYTNLSLVSTFFFSFIIICLIWLIIGIVYYACESLRYRLSSLKLLLYNFFSFGAVFAGSLSIQGAITNPISTLSVNSIFYIIGIVMFISIFV
jgi:hypothetical protein